MSNDTIMVGNKKFMRIVIFLSFLVPICFSYRKIFDGFFTQDELFSFGYIYALQKSVSFIDLLKFLFAPSITHYNPFTNSIEYFLFSIWGMDYAKFAALGIILHTAVTVAVYKLAKRVFKNNIFMAISAAFIFAAFASTYQATAWVVVDIATLTASLLGVISTIFFIDFIEFKKPKPFVVSMALLLVSLFFKEITVGLFVLFFVVLFLKRKDRIIKKSLMMVFYIGLFYLSFRLLMLFTINETTDKLVIQSQSFSRLFYNFLTIPPKALTQTIVPVELIKEISFTLASLLPDKMTGAVGSPAFEVFAVKRVMETLNLVFAMLTTGLGILIATSKKNKKFKGIIFLSLLWTYTNSLIFSLSPEVSGIVSAVDSRNLYFVAIGIAFFVVVMIKICLKENSKAFMAFSLVLMFNLFFLNKNLTEFTDQGKIRKYIFSNIYNTYPNLPQKTVFYITSDRSYYGLPETDRILPFQSGMGNTLLVLYFSKNNFPREFFEDKFLWEIKSQGYKEVNETGFGYFREIDLLKSNIKKYNIPIDSIISFSWNGDRNKIIDITQKVRQELSEQ